MLVQVSEWNGSMKCQPPFRHGSMASGAVDGETKECVDDEGYWWPGSNPGIAC